jgi:hypothetical protein
MLLPDCEHRGRSCRVRFLELEIALTIVDGCLSRWPSGDVDPGIEAVTLRCFCFILLQRKRGYLLATSSAIVRVNLWRSTVKDTLDQASKHHNTWDCWRPASCDISVLSCCLDILCWSFQDFSRPPCSSRGMHQGVS